MTGKALWLSLWLSLWAFAFAQESTLPSSRLTREDRVITVQQTATDEEGGIFASRTGCEEEKEDISLTTIFAPTPRLVETTVNDTLITSNIVLREQPSGDQDNAVLTMQGGTLEFNEETFCPENIAPTTTPDVTLKEGRTTVHGVSFVYDNATGIGTMDQSGTLERAAEGDSPALDASFQKLEYNSDEDFTILTGGVEITSENRVSKAERVEYFEKDGVAILEGNPAQSQDGDNLVEGKTIIYYLDSNDVIVKEFQSGVIEVELE